MLDAALQSPGECVSCVSGGRWCSGLKSHSTESDAGAEAALTPLLLMQEVSFELLY